MKENSRSIVARMKLAARKGSKMRPRPSLFVTLMVSFTIVFFIPVGIGVALYLQVENRMESNVQRYNMAMLEQIQVVMDGQLQEIEQIASQMVTDPLIQEMLSNRDLPEESSNPYKFVELIADLLRYKNSSGLIEDMYIYLARSNTIVTSTSKNRSDFFFSKLYSHGSYSYEQWQSEVLERYHYKYYASSLDVLHNGEFKSVIPYMQSLPFGEFEALQGQLVILVNEPYIMDMIKRVEWANHGTILVFNEVGELLLATAGEQSIPHKEKLTEAMQGESGWYSFDDEIDGSQQVVVYSNSIQTGWTYVSVIPTSSFLGNLHVVKNMALIVLFCCLIVGIAVAYVLAYRNYRPVKFLVQSVRKWRGTGPTIRNEYEYIEASILQGAEDEKHLQSIIQQQEPVMRTYFLSRLLKGHVETASIGQETLEFMGVQLISDKFLVVLIQIDDCKGFMENDSEREWALIRSVVANIILELVQDSGYGNSIELDKDRIAILLNLHHTRWTRAKEEMTAVADQLIATLQIRFKTKITLAVSSVHSGLEHIGTTYLEALKAMNYKFVLNGLSTIHFDQITHTDDYYSYPIEIESQIINFAHSGDYSSIERLLTSLVQEQSPYQRMTPELAKCLFYEVVGTLAKVIQSLGVKHSSLFDGKPDPIEQLSASGTFEEMLETVKSYYRMICEYVQAYSSDQGGRLADSICVYIQEHYSDSMLSLNTISDHFQYTVSYVSTFFKKQKGRTLTDYIAEVRIGHAKRMLREESLTIVEIAREVGYANDVGFTRMFKKREGVTPGKYRERIRLE